MKAQQEIQAFTSTLMPPPPNRQPSAGNGNGGAIRTGSPKSTQARQPTNTDLIEMAANQSIQEEAQNNGGVEVVKKVNINFQCLKLNDSKKRLRPNMIPVGN